MYLSHVVIIGLAFAAWKPEEMDKHTPRETGSWFKILPSPLSSENITMKTYLNRAIMVNVQKLNESKPKISSSSSLSLNFLIVENYILRRDLEPIRGCPFVGQSKRGYTLTGINNRKNQMLLLNNNGNEEKEFNEKDERMNTNLQLCIRLMVDGCHSLVDALLLIRVVAMTPSSTHSTILKS